MPGSRWGDAIGVMAEMHWSYDAYLAAPAELVDELTARMNGRAKAEQEQQRRQEAQRRRR